VLNLTNVGGSAPDKLEITLSAAVDVDTHVSFADYTGSAVNPGRENHNRATAAVHDLVAAPASGVVRNVKTIHACNKHATSPVDITIAFDQNGTDIVLHNTTLFAGEMLQYVEGIGFFITQTVRKAFFHRRVTADVALTNVTPTFADVTDLTCPVKAGKHYNFISHLYHFTSVGTVGARFGINGPAMTAMRIQSLDVVTGSVTAAAMSSNVSDVTAVNTAAIAQTTGHATTPVLCILTGWVNPSADGTFAIRGAAEATGTWTVKIGSFLQLWEADN